MWHGGQHGEPELLASCYRTSLSIALDKGLKSIAFPCISTGVYRYPKDQATRIALSTIGEIIADRPIDVTIVCFSEADKEFYITQD